MASHLLSPQRNPPVYLWKSLMKFSCETVELASIHQNAKHKKTSRYCWWKKSCTTLDVKNLVNTEVNYLSAGAGISSNSTTSCILLVWFLLALSWWATLSHWNFCHWLNSTDIFGALCQELCQKSKVENQPEEAWTHWVLNHGWPDVFLVGGFSPTHEWKICERQIGNQFRR